MARHTGLLGITCLLLFRGFFAQPVTYDQRQQGKVNVQVDVKDLQIVALIGSDMLDDFNYDYAYDYADFTVKPSGKPTTAKPSSTTKPNLEAESSSPSELSSSSTAVDSPTTKAPEKSVIKDSTLTAVNSTASTEIKIIESTISNVTKSDQDTSTTELNESTSSVNTANAEVSTKRPLGTAEPRKRCPTGFQMRSGRCFKRRHSLISPRLALMKLAPALLGQTQLFSEHLATGSS